MQRRVNELSREEDSTRDLSLALEKIRGEAKTAENTRGMVSELVTLLQRIKRATKKAYRVDTVLDLVDDFAENRAEREEIITALGELKKDLSDDDAPPFLPDVPATAPE